ncbi:hypothetical protein OS493_032128 [Desmophyllum pertusum]|uniref:Sodefrin-like factor n=1 Tax=Desmophyllum pertusum TaxID=174260 RepID=A0A9X0CJW2_9CNID|nr:hypothetical protein OS493_032128 [Desmophyllum pertusum]
MGRLWTIASLLCCSLLFSPAMSIKCFSCIGIIDTKCESRTTEVECHPTGQLIYDSCYTVTKIMDYPLIGRRVELLKKLFCFGTLWVLGTIGV